MKARLLLWRGGLCLGAIMLGSTCQSMAEPTWLAPSYHVQEITRLHYGGPNSSPEIHPYPMGLGANSQVIYNTRTASGGRYYLWQPQAQFGRPAGTSLLTPSTYTSFAGPIGTGVTSDGRFAEEFLTTDGPLPAGLRWWNGSQWVSLVPNGTGTAQRFVTPTWVLGVNDKGDVAFNYTLTVNAGLPGGATNLSRAGLWSGALQDWQPIFPENTHRVFVLGMNSHGTVCGIYRAATAPAGTAHRGFTATYGTTPIDFIPLGTIGGYSQTHGINDANEIVGVTGTQGGGVRPFIYLPAAAHGLASGLHEIGPTMGGYTGSGGSPLPVTARIFINNRGQALLTPCWSRSYLPNSPTNRFLWQRGQTWPLEQLADVSAYASRYAGDSPWYADASYDPETIGDLALSATRGFNDRGEILLGQALSYDSPPETQYDQVILVLRPKLTSSLALDHDRIAPGTTNKVRLRLLNEFTAALHAPGAPTLHWDGPGAPVIVNGPTLSSTNATWSPGGTNEWVWTFYFTNETKGIFVAQGSAGTNRSTIVEGSLLKVQDQADLWVRRTNDTVWKGDGIYAEAALPSQTREQAIQPTETAAFQVRLQNDSERARALTVQATASGDPGWLATYRQGATDVSALITGAGLNLGTLASGAYVDLSVILRGTNALDSGSRREIVFTGKAVGATNGSDLVMVAAEVLNEIIVNSTADLPDASLLDGVPDVNTNTPGLQTTLRCAIDFANRREGADLIKFEIPAKDGNWVDGVPQFEPATALPEITETVVIDGWTQNTNALTPPVAISGKLLPRPPRPTSLTFPHEWPGAIPGLTVRGEACEIRGLVINQFPAGLELAGAGSHIVEGCFIGLNAAGTEPRGNGIWSLVIQGLSEGHPLAFGRPLTLTRGWDMRVTSPLNRIGGGQSRQRNAFGSAGQFIPVTGISADWLELGPILNTPVHIWVRGTAAFGTQIIGSRFGVRADGTALLSRDADNVRFDHQPQTANPAILVDNAPGTLIGGSGVGEGNIIGGALVAVSLVGADTRGTVIWGNTMGGNNIVSGTGVVADGSGSVNIGGLNPGEGNLISPDTHFSCIRLSRLTGSISRILGNQLGWPGTVISASPRTLVDLAPDSVPMEVRGNSISGYLYKGISISGEENNPASTVRVIDNSFSSNTDPSAHSGVAIEVGSGSGHSFIGNRMLGSDENRLIRLGYYFNEAKAIPPLPNDDLFFDLDGGPNGQLNWPVMATALLTGGQLQVQAGLDTTPLSGQYSIHVYRCFSDLWGHGQPQELLATGIGTADASGRAAFVATVPQGVVSEGDFLCATATGPDGSTSEVGPVRRVIGGPDFDADGNGDATEETVPNRPVPHPGQIVISGPGFGDGNGDGTPDFLQANVTSFPVAASQWLTIVAPAGIAFGNAQLTAIPTLTNVPAAYRFPLGFVSFTLNGLTPGATVSVTNILHSSVTISNVVAFGPTPANPQPHWYTLNFTRSNDELRLSITDGGDGDHDLSANGSITTLYAPAYQLPPVPQLTLLSATPATVSIAVPDDSGTNSTLVTNAYSSVMCALAWPATATNYIVEFTSSLSPPDWFPLAGAAVVIGNQLVVTNLSLAPTRFYRLRPGQ